jgi:hypothetical protein
MLIKEAAESGSERDLLAAVRDKIAVELDNGVSSRDLAALTKRLMEVRREILALDAAEKGDEIGDAVHTPDQPL